MLNEILNSEYNNAGELFGLDAANYVLQNGNPAQKAQLIKKLSTSGKDQQSKGSRNDFEKGFNQLPPHIKEGLRNGKLRLADYTVYSTKVLNATTIKMFESQDVKETGVRNVSNAKLPKNMVLMVSGIFLLAGTKDANAEDGHKRVKFGSIQSFEALANGEFSLKSNKKQIIPEGNSLRSFITDHNLSIPLGYYKLDNPRYIMDDEVFEFTLDLGTDKGLSADSFVYVGLDGTITTP